MITVRQATIIWILIIGLTLWFAFHPGDWSSSTFGPDYPMCPIGYHSDGRCVEPITR